MKYFLNNRHHFTSLLVLTLFAFWGTHVSAKCAPGQVNSLEFTSDYVLHWSQSSNPSNCTIVGYLIYVTDLKENVVELYESDDSKQTFYNFSNLGMCTKYRFDVVPLTDDHVLGQNRPEEITTPSPTSGIDLQIVLDKENVTSSNRSIDVSWKLAYEKGTPCVSYYRLVLWNSTNIPTDIYLDEPFYTFEDPVPCMSYEFQVRAIVTNPEVEGPFSLTRSVGLMTPTTPPKLLNITTTATSVEMIWELEQFEKNQCTIESLVVETLPNSSFVFNVTDNMRRDPVAVNITNLNPDTVYISKVYVVNTGGASKKITVTFQTDDDYQLFND